MDVPALAWIAVLLICIGSSWLARRFAIGLNWTQRKLMLYILVFAPLIPLAADSKGIGATIAIIGYLAAIPSFFAVLFAPDKT